MSEVFNKKRPIRQPFIKTYSLTLDPINVNLKKRVKKIQNRFTGLKNLCF